MITDPQGAGRVTPFNTKSDVSGMASKSVATHSIVNPLLFLTVIVTPTMTAGSLFATGPMVLFFAIMAALPVLATLFAYWHFARADPEKLQSERFRIERQWITAQLGDNQTKQVIDLSANNELVANNAVEGSDR